MADSIKTLLFDAGVLAHVVLTSGIDAMLGALEVTAPPRPEGDGIWMGAVTLTHDLSKSPIPGFDFALALPSTGVDVPFKLKLEPADAPTGFKFWLQLADEQHARAIFKFVEGVPGYALTGAQKKVDAGDGSVSLEALPVGDPNHQPHLVSRSVEPGAALGPALLVSASPAGPSSVRFTSDLDSTEGVIALGLEPSTVLFGSSKIGFDLPTLVIDDSETAKGPGVGAPALDPPKATIDADTPSWRGILARELDFYLPADMPLFGGQPIKGFVAIPSGAGGPELIIETKVPARAETPQHPSRPGYSLRIECLDPAATGLSGLVPTLISATMELPLDGAKVGFNDDGAAAREIFFGAGKPVRATATISRDPVNAPGEMKLVLSVAGQGQDGLMSVTAHEMGGAKIFNTAAALATALIADKNVDRKAKVGDTTGVFLDALLAAGAVLSSLFTGDSTFVLHGVEIESSGHGAPVGGEVVLTLDYSVAVIVTGIDVGALSVSMNPNQPMRVRIRKARMSVDPHKSGLSMIGLDFDRATMEVENPGAWNVGGLESLFDVLRSRSGRGSSWIEVDLGFKLNLGPVKVSGATIRATLTDSGSIEASIRGLEAGIEIPGAIEGSGALRLLSNPDGFTADLRASLLPLNVWADAGVVYAPPKVLLRLDVDLPAPLPLANTGFGLLGVGGLLGFSARPDYESVAESDPVARQLKWEPKGAESFKAAAGQSSFGLSAAVGTLPDLGFTFSAKAGMLVTAPDLAIRASLNGRVLQPAVKLSDPSWPPPPGLSFLGFLGVDSSALSFALLGQVLLQPLIEIKVPLAGHFPFKADASDWYVYLGADGAPAEGRGIGPISAKVLPDILGVEADAYFMVRGDGLADWPFGRRMLSVADGFVIAFGFSLQSTFGVKPIVWAELYAGLDLLIASKPLTLAGFGRAGGSLNLGPFSLGVDAQVKFMVVEAATYFWAEVTGRIELLFFDVEGHVTISFGDNEPALKLPPPDRHPLDRVDRNGAIVGWLGSLTDDTYRVVAELAEDWTKAPTVWPDTIVSIPFGVAPEINQASAGAQFPGVNGPGATPAPVRLGTEMLHYNWRLDTVALRDVTDEADKVNGAGTAPAGQLSASWQLPRAGAGGSDVSELLLFSTGPDLWVNRLADAGAGLPGGDPLQYAADICNATVRGPLAGWAVGFLARQAASGFVVPADPVSANPRVSRVEADMHHYGVFPQLVIAGRGLGELPLDDVRTLPEPYSLHPAGLVAWPDPASIERKFAGHIVAPNLHWLEGQSVGKLRESGGFLAQAISLELREPIVDGELILVVDPELVRGRDADWLTTVRVFDDNGQWWTNARTLTIPTGEQAILLTAPTGDAVRRLDVLYPLGVALGVVGVGGITGGARDAVAREQALLAEEAARQAAAAAQGPPTGPGSNAPHTRAILDPGRLYRIDIDMSWAGELSKQDERGQIKSLETSGFDDPRAHTYAAAGRLTKRSLFFRTAPKGTASAPLEGAAALLYWLRAKQEVFKPEMLQRYLGGYEPAQAEEFRFCDDPLRAHFTQDHVAALAATYGFDLQVAVRRVDRAGDAYAKPALLTPLWSFATNPAFLSSTDRIRYRYALASDCDVPLPGATATAPNPGLEPEAWYDVNVLATSTTFADGELPGVLFRTSRWRDPLDMLAGIGLTSDRPAAPVVSGDLEVTAPSTLVPAVVDDDDQVFQNALAALGLEGWPTAAEPRLSRLWVPGAAGEWLFAGLLLESPEPIHRPGRLEVDGLTLQMGSAGAAVSFGVRRRDRAGARLLLMTASPFPIVTRELVRSGFPVHGAPARIPLEQVFLDEFAAHGGLFDRPQFRAITATLVLNARSILHEGTTPVSASIVLPVQPGFVGEP